MTARVDVLVIGGGPGGAVTAALLARMGHAVEVWDAAKFPRFRIGESLPPRCVGLLKHLGFEKHLSADRFAVMQAHTSVWGSSTAKRVPFDEGYGLQVERSRLDTVLLKAARIPVFEGRRATSLIRQEGRVAGARYSDNGRSGETRARFVVLASGAKSGLGQDAGNRQFHLRQWAIFSYWRCTDEPSGAEANDTIVESIPNGWVWSLRLASGLRNVTVLFGQDSAPAVKSGMTSLYMHSIASTVLVRRLLKGATMDGQPAACDATWQQMDRFAKPGVVLVGDAGSVIDPLSSQGVYKSICSALTAAVVLNTAIRRPGMEQTSFDYFHDEEQKTYDGYAGASVRTLRTEDRWADRPFWLERHNLTRWDSVADIEAVPPPIQKDQFAIETGLANDMRLAAAPDVQVEPRASISGSFVELSDCLVSAKFSHGYRGPHANAMIELFRDFSSGQTIREVLRSFSVGETPARLRVIAYMHQEGLLQRT